MISNAWSRKSIKRKIKEIILASGQVAKKPQDSDSLFLSLRFDSLRITALFEALEKEFGRSLLLNDWIRQSLDPTTLTVDSLCNHVYQALQTKD